MDLRSGTLQSVLDVRTENLAQRILEKHMSASTRISRSFPPQQQEDIPNNVLHAASPPFSKRVDADHVMLLATTRPEVQFSDATSSGLNSTPRDISSLSAADIWKSTICAEDSTTLIIRRFVAGNAFVAVFADFTLEKRKVFFRDEESSQEKLDLVHKDESEKIEWVVLKKGERKEIFFEKRLERLLPLEHVVAELPIAAHHHGLFWEGFDSEGKLRTQPLLEFFRVRSPPILEVDQSILSIFGGGSLSSTKKIIVPQFWSSNKILSHLEKLFHLRGRSSTTSNVGREQEWGKNPSEIFEILQTATEESDTAILHVFARWSAAELFKARLFSGTGVKAVKNSPPNPSFTVKLGFGGEFFAAQPAPPSLQKNHPKTADALFRLLECVRGASLQKSSCGEQGGHDSNPPPLKLYTANHALKGGAPPFDRSSDEWGVFKPLTECYARGCTGCKGKYNLCYLTHLKGHLNNFNFSQKRDLAIVFLQRNPVEGIDSLLIRYNHYGRYFTTSDIILTLFEIINCQFSSTGTCNAPTHACAGDCWRGENFASLALDALHELATRTFYGKHLPSSSEKKLPSAFSQTLPDPEAFPYWLLRIKSDASDVSRDGIPIGQTEEGTTVELYKLLSEDKGRIGNGGVSGILADKDEVASIAFLQEEAAKYLRAGFSDSQKGALEPRWVELLEHFFSQRVILSPSAFAALLETEVRNAAVSAGKSGDSAEICRLVFSVLFLVKRQAELVSQLIRNQVQIARTFSGEGSPKTGAGDFSLAGITEAQLARGGSMHYLTVPYFRNIMFEKGMQVRVKRAVELGGWERAEVVSDGRNSCKSASYKVSGRDGVESGGSFVLVQPIVDREVEVEE